MTHNLFFVSASSLIFVVIFAVWGAYMLQHWVRRREDLATARSVDRFSEAMRMLERRTPVKLDMSSHRADADRPGLLRPQGSTQVAAEIEKDETPSKLAGVRKTAATGAVRVTARAPKISLTSPEAKLGVLLAATAFFLLTLVLAPFSIVPAWLPVVGFLAMGGTLVWLRRVAVKNRAARAQRASAPKRPVEEATSESAPVRTERTVSADRAAGPARPVRMSEPKRSPMVAEHLPASNDEVFDQEPDLNSVARAEAEVFDAGWDPVAVPRPTYTMKAKAARAQVTPAAVVENRPLAARYENTPVAELPFDGMALDEDYDELPQVYRAG